MAKSRRAKKQIKKLTQKWVFRGPNKALIKSGFKRPNWSHLGEEKNVKEREKRRGRGRGRRRREEEEEGIKPKRYGNYFEY